MSTVIGTVAAGADAGARAIIRILVVDDDLDGADILSALLEAWGFEVSTCYDGLSAERLALEHRPQLVLLDVNMPRRDGYDTARALRAMPQLAGTRIVAMSGIGPEASYRARPKEARETPFDAFMIKPLIVPALREMLGVSEPRPRIG